MFFITCFKKIEKDKNGFLETGYARTFGFKESFEEAEKALNENRCDMRETIYNYAVVEEINAGIHPEVEMEAWFKWNEEKQGFYRIEKPEPVLHFCNFALG